MGISEKEFAVIREIHNNHLPDQRTIAVRTGISLGLTNLIIQRLIKKGYIKAKQLNRKKIHYILTPKGFSEKAKKSYHFTLKTISLFKLMKEKIQELILEQYKKGRREFIIYGNNELVDITELVFHTLSGYSIKYHRRINSNIESRGESIATLDMVSESDDGTLSVNLISYLAESGLFYG